MSVNYSFAHLLNMSTDQGLFEHAEYQSPREEHGYCVDDIARGLVTISRERNMSPEVAALAPIYLRFINAAQAVDGRSHNRMNTQGQWTDEPTLEDCWGRSLWALGTAVARMPALREPALAAFERGAVHRSPWLHANCFAALGAAEVLSVQPLNPIARNALRSTAFAIQARKYGRHWPWPERRLSYANGAVPEVMILAGHYLDEPRWLHDGLSLLRWLVEVETIDGHVSVTPVGGWGQGEPRPGFDQQPIEVSSLADACNTAYQITGDDSWLDVVRMCAAWFEGDNDAGVAMTDAEHSVGFDGLHRTGRNHNGGAESTLAMLSTFQLLKNQLVSA